MQNLTPITWLDHLSERKFFILLFVIVFLIGLFLSLPALSYYWYTDDLFIVRRYTNAELLTAFTGNWDISGLLTPGWRPLTVAYYHLQSLLFGEAVQLHRLLAISMFSLHITLLMLVARQLKFSRLTMLIAALIYVCTKNTWWMMIWATDALRSPMGILANAAILMLIAHLKQPKGWKFALAVLFYALALLIREEILFYTAIIPTLAFVYLLQRDDLLTQLRRWLSVSGLRTLVIYGGIVITLTVAYWIVRGRLVPQSPLPLNLEGILFQMVAVLFPRLPAPSLVGSVILIVLFWIVLIVALRVANKQVRWLTLIFLSFVLIACTPGISSWRADNLLQGIGFFALFVALLLRNFMRRSRLAAGVAVLALVGFIGGSAYMHKLAQETMHPYSLYSLEMIYKYTTEGYARSTIPLERVEYIKAEYAALGINSQADFDAIYPKIRESVQEGGPYHPDGEKPFMPWYPTFLSPW